MSLLAQGIARRAAAVGATTAIGTVEVDDDGKLAVSVGGARLGHPVWVDPVIAEPGDSVLVLFQSTAGQSSAVVLARVSDQPRPATGMVTATPSGGRVTVSIGGVEADCRYLDAATPGVGDSVALLWWGREPLVLGEVASATPTPPAPAPAPTPPPPTPPSGGTPTFAASASSTWSVAAGGWSSYFGSDLRQGSWQGRTYTGSWFYGNAPRGSGTVTRARIFLAARSRVGNYNSAMTLHLYLHSHVNKGGGEPPRISGPHDITLAPNAGAAWHDIPTGWGQHIRSNGGGISIAGNPYGGVDGRSKDARSGSLTLFLS